MAKHDRAGVTKTLHQRRFLAAFGVSGSITQATRWAKISRWAHYQWMKLDPGYPARFRAATEQAARMLEDEAVRRAYHGIRREVRYKGKVIGHEVEYSDTLLVALLKANNPEKFGDKSKVDLNVPSITDISQVPTEVLLQLLPEEERKEFIREPNWLLNGPAPVETTAEVVKE